MPPSDVSYGLCALGAEPLKPDVSCCGPGIGLVLDTNHHLCTSDTSAFD